MSETIENYWLDVKVEENPKSKCNKNCKWNMDREGGNRGLNGHDSQGNIIRQIYCAVEESYINRDDQPQCPDYQKSKY